MNFAAIAEDIAALEARLGATSTSEAEALAASIAERLAAVRRRNDAEARAALDALLEPARAPAAIYVIETYAVMAAMYADMGDGARASAADASSYVVAQESVAHALHDG